MANPIRAFNSFFQNSFKGDYGKKNQDSGERSPPATPKLDSCLPLSENWKLVMDLTVSSDEAIEDVQTLDEVLGMLVDEYNGPVGFRSFIFYCYFALGSHLRLKNAGSQSWLYNAQMGDRFQVNRDKYAELVSPIKWCFDKKSQVGTIRVQVLFNIEISAVIRRGRSLYSLIKEDSYVRSQGNDITHPFQRSPESSLELLQLYGIQVDLLENDDVMIHENALFSSTRE